MVIYRIHGQWPEFSNFLLEFFKLLYDITPYFLMRMCMCVCVCVFVCVCVWVGGT